MLKAKSYRKKLKNKMKVKKNKSYNNLQIIQKGGFLKENFKKTKIKYIKNTNEAKLSDDHPNLFYKTENHSSIEKANKFIEATLKTKGGGGMTFKPYKPLIYLLDIIELTTVLSGRGNKKESSVNRDKIISLNYFNLIPDDLFNILDEPKGFKRVKDFVLNSWNNGDEVDETTELGEDGKRLNKILHNLKIMRKHIKVKMVLSFIDNIVYAFENNIEKLEVNVKDEKLECDYEKISSTENTHIHEKLRELISSRKTQNKEKRKKDKLNRANQLKEEAKSKAQAEEEAERQRKQKEQEAEEQRRREEAQRRQEVDSTNPTDITLEDNSSSDDLSYGEVEDLKFRPEDELKEYQRLPSLTLTDAEKLRRAEEISAISNQNAPVQVTGIPYDGDQTPRDIETGETMKKASEVSEVSEATSTTKKDKFGNTWKPGQVKDIIDTGLYSFQNEIPIELNIRNSINKTKEKNNGYVGIKNDEFTRLSQGFLEEIEEAARKLKEQRLKAQKEADDAARELEEENKAKAIEKRRLEEELLKAKKDAEDAEDTVQTTEDMEKERQAAMKIQKAFRDRNRINEKINAIEKQQKENEEEFLKQKELERQEAAKKIQRLIIKRNEKKAAAARKAAEEEAARKAAEENKMNQPPPPSLPLPLPLQPPPPLPKSVDNIDINIDKSLNMFRNQKNKTDNTNKEKIKELKLKFIEELKKRIKESSVSNINEKPKISSSSSLPIVKNDSIVTFMNGEWLSSGDDSRNFNEFVKKILKEFDKSNIDEERIALMEEMKKNPMFQQASNIE